MLVAAPENYVERGTLMELQKVFAPQPQGIDAILDEAGRNFAAGTLEYEIGVQHGYAMAKEASIQEAFQKMIVPAETFFMALGRFMSDVEVRQVRIGFDYSCGRPVALFVLGQDAESKHEEIMESAREVELLLWEKLKVEANIWTLIDGDIDQESIERDFPLYRTKVA